MERKQGVVINGRVFTWENVNARVPQGFILGPFLFLIILFPILFFDDGPICRWYFFVFCYSWHSDICKGSQKRFWNFNPDRTKQAQEVTFSRKAKETYHPPLVFINASDSQSLSQKYLILDSELIFDEHLKMISLKINKTLGLFQKLQNLLPRSTLTEYLKLLSDPILIMVISFMIKLIIGHFTKNWNLFSIMLALP